MSGGWGNVFHLGSCGEVKNNKDGTVLTINLEMKKIIMIGN